MSHERFDIYFAGELLPEGNEATVRTWLGAQFKLQGAALERLFSGQPVRIKQAVDADTAGRYRAAFRKAGAALEIRPVEAQPGAGAAAAASSAATAPPAQDADPELLPANTGTLEDCAAPVAAAPVPDISHMALDMPGQTLDERPPPADAHFDTGDMALDMPGQTLDEQPPAPAADIDTSGLSALPPNSGDLSDCAREKPAQPLPDISQLGLTDD